MSREVSKLVDGQTLTWALDHAKVGDRAIEPHVRTTMDRLPDMVHAGTGAVCGLPNAPQAERGYQ